MHFLHLLYTHTNLYTLTQTHIHLHILTFYILGGGSVPLSVYRLRKRRIFFVGCASQRSVTAARPLPPLRACFLSAFDKDASSSSSARLGVQSRPQGRSFRFALASSNLLSLTSVVSCYAIRHLLRRLRVSALVSSNLLPFSSAIRRYPLLPLAKTRLLRKNTTLSLVLRLVAPLAHNI